VSEMSRSYMLAAAKADGMRWRPMGPVLLLCGCRRRAYGRWYAEKLLLS
jgi:hypothetical protein